MIATFIDLDGRTFVREIKKLEKVYKYNTGFADAFKSTDMYFTDKELPMPVKKTQTYILQSVTNNIPLYKEVIEGWKDTAAKVSSKTSIAVEEPKKVIAIDTTFEDMYKKLKGE